MSIFQKATKKQAKLRLAIYGASGSGKTYTSLRIAKGLGGSVALIDTERGSASKYADRFDFLTVQPENANIKSILSIIEEAKKENIEILIIDSLTHAWQELLDEIDLLARTKYSGNSFRAWSEGTPKQRELIQAILTYPGHVIATMRSKTEYVVETNAKGKTAPKRIGLAPEQGKGIEYEFDMLIEMDVEENIASIKKDRTGKFQNEIIKQPGEKLGKQLLQWLNTGLPSDFCDTLDRMVQIFKKDRIEVLDSITKKYKIRSIEELSKEQLEEVKQKLEASIQEAIKAIEEKKAEKSQQPDQFITLLERYGKEVLGVSLSEVIQVTCDTFSVKEVGELTPQQMSEWEKIIKNQLNNK